VVLFKAIREQSKKLNEEGFNTSRYLIRKSMKKLKLKVEQRLAFKVTIECKHGNKVADNFIKQNFNPLAHNEVGWRHHLFKDSSRLDIFGNSIGFILTPNCELAHKKPMTTDLISKATCYQGGKFDTAQTGFVFHSDRGS
jgi:putative transposase